ncbi:MAG: tetratricopeptide repeat protein [Holophagaceae bacterium]|nr:tetratricopeptide repeat protein [Holophagaceae bacterium]
MSACLPAWVRTSLLLGSLVLGGTRAAPTQEVDSAIFQRYRSLDSAIEQADRATSERRFEEARKFLEPCLQKQPDHFEAHFLLARMAYEARDFEGALAHLDVAERSLALLNRRYRDLMDYLKARIEVEEQTARSNLEAVNMRVTDPTSCVAPYLAALEREVVAVQARKGPLHDVENPYGVPASHRFLRGNALYRLSRRDEARAQFRQAVAIDPAHANAWNNLLALDLEAKDPAQARADLQKAEAARVAVRPELRQAILAAP